MRSSSIPTRPRMSTSASARRSASLRSDPCRRFASSGSRSTVASSRATRRQVLRSVIVESAAIGVLASVIGLFTGFGLASGLSYLLGVLGLGLPTAAPVYALQTVVVSLLLGIVVTVLAGILPAMRATR